MKKKTLVLLVTVILAAAVCAGLALLLRQEPESPASQKTAAQTLLNRSDIRRPADRCQSGSERNACDPRA